MVSDQIAIVVWNLSMGTIRATQILLVAMTVGVVIARKRWNPIGQAFAAAVTTGCLVHLAFGVRMTVGAYLSSPAEVASGSLLVLETTALILIGSFAFESHDRDAFTDRDLVTAGIAITQRFGHQERPDVVIAPALDALRAEAPPANPSRS